MLITSNEIRTMFVPGGVGAFRHHFCPGGLEVDQLKIQNGEGEVSN